MNRLIEIQNELKAPKNQRNTFGNYNYRSCEDILEAVKPLLMKHKLALIISDEVCNIGERYYVRAVAQLYDGKELLAETVAYAREEESKKGMDASQITGSTSSYARKYALNGLFAIDDNKDSDATNKHEETKKSSKEIIKERVQEIKDDLEIFGGIAECKTEEDCIRYWNENVGKLQGGMEARKQLATLKKQRIDAIKGGKNE